ncbi:nickel-responsive transcriptional regulator NikR [Pseudomonas veronii]|uniref:nickel-responsive transcriptional regulator NikR n=1 Tax=Pseudomonas veronii TaxID=76761 RepID=UPI001E44F807|nr:nickel-responsive transcriptional regulator NikR [Pseudomonas veronii]UHH32797.1 nickel-responsive transcriptional regulator NikR [Pseudomonas veronii]
MERLTISLDRGLAEELDALIRDQGYHNRSEAMRDILRRHIEQARLEQGQAPHCVANLSFVYDHHSRTLTERVMDLQHAHHHLTIASQHVHLDHDNCLESLMLKGSSDEVRDFAHRVCAERGVRHGSLNLIPVEQGVSHEQVHSHLHLHPKS